ncbi:MAG: helix-turn-helix domain-containing protein [Oscillospiraceae bacterium]
MYELDKKKFGAFVALLRREKGWTQRELAERLYISDKAVSKWETGASIPDTALLMPLAELLGVSVTELLRCERLGGGMDAGQVEDLVKTAISYGAQKRSAPGARAGTGRPCTRSASLLGGACLVGACSRAGSARTRRCSICSAPSSARISCSSLGSGCLPTTTRTASAPSATGPSA